MTTLTRLLDLPSRLTVLDRPAALARTAVQRLAADRPVAELLRGRPIGHPAHPGLVHLPVGAALSTAVLDAASALTMRGGHRDDSPARLLTAVAVVSAVPAAAAGWVDTAELHPDQQRTALVHAAGNLAAVTLWAASLRSRRHAVLLRTTGTLVSGMAAALGGHLAYRWSAGANHAEQWPHLAPEGWHPVGDAADFPEGRPGRADVGGTPVLLVRTPDGWHAMVEQCSHLGGPLADGELTERDGETCIVCPWHGSTFRLRDGEPVAGPATAPQPMVAVRTFGGQVQARVLPAEAHLVG